MRLKTIKFLTKAHRSAYYLDRRYVSKLSPLAQIFNTKPTPSRSFKLANVGLFQVPDLSSPEGFYVLQENATVQIEKLVKEIIKKQRSRKLVVIFDELSNCICKVADLADCVQTIHPCTKFATAAEDCRYRLSGLIEELNTNTDIYDALKRVIEEGDIIQTDDIDHRVAELFLSDFEQSGIHLPEEKRKKFVRLNEAIMVSERLFLQGLENPSVCLKSNLPDHLKNVFSLDGDNVMMFSSYSEHYNDDVREAAYKVYHQPDKTQLKRLDHLLYNRHQLAQLVGFPSYGHRAARGTMLATPEKIMEFLDLVSAKVKPSAAEDYQKILELKRQSGSKDKKLSHWDLSYYSAVGRQTVLDIDVNQLAPYFSIGTCMDGLNNLVQSLYGVTLKHVEIGKGETWNFDVYKLEVIDEQNNILGYIYCDFFERVSKPNQDCHYTIQGGCLRSDGTDQLPVVVLQLNLPSPHSTYPCLLTPHMLNNLFHEFGHAMHSVLGRTRYQHVTGTRCSTDIAEVPSILMEYFMSDPQVLSTFARHYKTGEKLDSNIIQKLCDSKSLFSGYETQLQVFYSALDQVYHSQIPSDTTKVLAEVHTKYFDIPYVEGTAWQLRFGHLVGYGAKYYSYLLSKAIASTIWNKYFEKDPLNRSMGEKFRYNFLAHGGGQPSKDLVQGMLNETPTIETLVDSLVPDKTP
ncbi:hypothetical protein LOTGIDRAFT_198714 [Lottia gigantea]|uniref:Peptidase M3A/M3B catalytic domain-containing protein n=1 Tax=Lottia gigantea TaxID=225164 RepID=V4CPN6_LOTGI|nr:hypothetical protein LOTGIDRAFT_198714 [Lottia gigantea]ESP04365.1 hypothetical protein LOTGIDRAFT_198714 [Lottia gigantea]